jgi:hypothetical protein
MPEPKNRRLKMRLRNFLTVMLISGCVIMGGCATDVCLLNYVKVSSKDTPDTKRQNLINNEVLKANYCPMKK